jgi:hypothetical protein
MVKQTQTNLSGCEKLPLLGVRKSVVLVLEFRRKIYNDVVLCLNSPQI